MDEMLRRRVLGMIFGLTVRDGELSDAEIGFLDRMYAAFDVSKDRESWVPAISDPKEAALELRAMPEESRKEALSLLVEAAAVDGVLHPAERRYLESVGQVVGLTPEQVEQRVVEQLAALKSP